MYLPRPASGTRRTTSQALASAMALSSLRKPTRRALLRVAQTATRAPARRGVRDGRKRHSAVWLRGLPLCTRTGTARSRRGAIAAASAWRIGVSGRLWRDDKHSPGVVRQVDGGAGQVAVLPPAGVGRIDRLAGGDDH